MYIQPIPQTKYERQEKITETGLITGLSALTAGVAGSFAGSFAEPDIFEYQKTAANIYQNSTEQEEKISKKIIKKLSKDENTKLSKNEITFLKMKGYEGKSSKETIFGLKQEMRFKDTNAIIERANKYLKTAEKRLKSLNKILEQSKKHPEKEQTMLASFIKKHKAELSDIEALKASKGSTAQFNNTKEAIEFFKKRADITKANRQLATNLQAKCLKELQNISIIVADSFTNQKSTLHEFITDAFKNQRAKKYGVFAALIAGSGALFASLVQSEKIKHIFTPVPVAVPVLVPVENPVSETETETETKNRIEEIDEKRPLKDIEAEEEPELESNEE